MQQALGLSGDLAMMFAIMVALGIAGIVALMMALFWPPRWRMTYRVEVVGVLVLVALGVFADLNSASTFNAYEEGSRTRNCRARRSTLRTRQSSIG